MFSLRTFNNVINKIREQALMITLDNNNDSFAELLARSQDMTNHRWNIHILMVELFKVVNTLYTFPANSFTKYKIKSNPKMYILIQSD